MKTLTLEQRTENKKIYDDYKEKYKILVDTNYPKLSTTQKNAMTYILIADSLTAEEMKDEDSPLQTFSFNTQKIENNLILTSQSSATLKVLQRKGLIEIITDGGRDIDCIKVIK